MAIYTTLEQIEWEPILISNSVDTNLAHFYQVLNDILTTCVPKKTNRTKTKYHTSYPFWITRETKYKIKNKNRLHKIYKENPSEDNYNAFSKARGDAKISTGADHLRYVSDMEDEIDNNPNKFYNYFKYKEKTVSSPHIMYWSDRVFTGSSEISEGFAAYFGSVYSSEMSELQSGTLDITNDSEPLVGMGEIDYDEIKEAIRNLKDTKSTGDDNIPTFVVKACASLFYRPLKHIFNQSINTSHFPNLWKRGKIVPIYKNQGDIDNMANYRPITIICVFAKVLESIVHKRIYFSVKTKISNQQHGCIPKRNINTNLLTLTGYVSETLDHGQQVDAFYSDFKKAFDSVDFSLLIQKLIDIGCDRKLVKWIYSFLTNRRLYVRVQDAVSADFTNNSGVPQGSSLGGLIFNIFVNDVGSVLKFTFFLLFVDDLKFYRRINNISDCHLLQNDIDALYVWSIVNKLPLNFAKCKVISFTRKKQTIEYKYKILNSTVNSQEDVKDLGVIFDKALNFKAQIFAITKRANSLAGYILRKTKNFTKINTYFRLFNSLVRPILEFASTVWSPSQDLLIRHIERVQTRFARSIFFRMQNGIDLQDKSFYYYYFSSTNLRELFSITELELRRDVQCIIFFKKLINGNFDNSTLLEKLNFHFNYIPLRHNFLFHTPTVRSNHARNYAIQKFCRTFNKIAHILDLFGTSDEVFKKECYALLRDAQAPTS